MPADAQTTRWRLADGRIMETGARFYPASCDHCGWIGSSELCGTDGGPWGDSDVHCPRCDMSGADCGKLTDDTEEIAHAE